MSTSGDRYHIAYIPLLEGTQNNMYVLFCSLEVMFNRYLSWSSIEDVEQIFSKVQNKSTHERCMNIELILLQSQYNFDV